MCKQIAEGDKYIRKWGLCKMTDEKKDPIENWNEVLLIYRSALKEINTKLEILNDEFQHVHRYNPIEHIKSRIKTSESIV